MKVVVNGEIYELTAEEEKKYWEENEVKESPDDECGFDAVGIAIEGIL